VDPPLAKPLEMMLIVSRRGGSTGVTLVRAGWWVGWGVYHGESHG